jgi:hypothetical protein
MSKKLKVYIGIVITAVLLSSLVLIVPRVIEQGRLTNAKIMAVETQRFIEEKKSETGEYPIVYSITDITMDVQFKDMNIIDKLKNDTKIYYSGDAEDYYFRVEWDDQKLEFTNNNE